MGYGIKIRTYSKKELRMKSLRMIITVFLAVILQSQIILPMEAPEAPPMNGNGEPAGVEDQLSKSLKTLKQQLESLSFELRNIGKKPKIAEEPTGGLTADIKKIKLKKAAPKTLPAGFKPKKTPTGLQDIMAGFQGKDIPKTKDEQHEILKTLLEAIEFEGTVDPSEFLKIENLDTLDYVKILGKNAQWNAIIDVLKATKPENLSKGDLEKWNKFIAKINADKERAQAKKPEEPGKSAEPTEDDIKRAAQKEVSENLQKFLNNEDQKALRHAKHILESKLKNDLTSVLTLHAWLDIDLLELYQQLCSLPNAAEYKHYSISLGSMITNVRKLPLPELSCETRTKITKILVALRGVLTDKFKDKFDIELKEFKNMNKSDAQIVLEADGAKNIDLQEVGEKLVAAGILPADHPLHVLIKKLIELRPAKAKKV